MNACTLNAIRSLVNADKRCMYALLCNAFMQTNACILLHTSSDLASMLQLNNPIVQIEQRFILLRDGWIDFERAGITLTRRRLYHYTELTQPQHTFHSVAFQTNASNTIIRNGFGRIQNARQRNTTSRRNDRQGMLVHMI
jgi:hypothetical protein